MNNPKTKSLLASLAISALLASVGYTQSISLSSPPSSVAAGQTVPVTVTYSGSSGGIVQVQLVNSGWNQVASEWRNVSNSSGSETFQVAIPGSTAPAGGHRWQALLYNSSWIKQGEDVFSPVTVTSAAASVALTAPSSINAGGTHSVTVDYNSPGGGIVAIQLFNSSWSMITQSYRNVPLGPGSELFNLTIPANTPAGSGYLWQAVLSNSSWVKQKEAVQYNVTVNTQAGTDYLPAGNWNLEWQDEFTGSAGNATDPKITKWYPFLGYTPTDFANNTEKGLRWANGSDPNTAQMYSTKTGNHWRDGSGHLLIQAICDKTGPTNAQGKRVKAAYLLSGYPDRWDNTEPTNVKWEPGNGKFVSPQGGDLYITARIRTDKVVGHSTWFAFWLFTETRAYNNVPSNGTEVDIIEVAKGAPSYMNKSFNVANHWGSSESKQFSVGTTPPSTSFVDVTDSNYHTYAIQWSPTSMKCSVDGQVYYTFTDNIPTNPVDMMMLLTMEFQPNAWDPNQGDGRTSGPKVSENTNTRVMSQALIDYVRVYRKQ